MTSDEKDEPNWYSSLISWIDHNGGFVHPSLTLKQDERDQNYRSIVALRDITSGDVLVKVPESIVISGDSFPDKYHITDDQSEYQVERCASSWLRCIAALMSAYERNAPENYLDSLPSSYDTLISESWTDKHVQSFLAGTTLGSMVLKDRSSGSLKTRFTNAVLPYLQSNGIMKDKDAEDIYRSFCLASQCISTRGFHLKEEEDGSILKEKGPYLLPFIDLLNHSTDPSKRCTTLHKSENFFIMVAERNIKIKEEILHSYGSNSSASLLQTFGFVDHFLIQRAASGALTKDHQSSDDDDVTPAVLSKSDVIAACATVAQSDLPKTLASHIESRPELEEYDVWTIPSNSILTSRNNSEIARQFPDELLVDYRLPLSDDLITLCCCQFLPDEAYDEICVIRDNEGRNICMISADILQDYFLGSLVLKSLRLSTETKLSTYSNISTCTERLNILLTNTETSTVDEVERAHEMYALSVSIEEQSCLHKLLNVISSFEEELNLLARESHSKRVKL